MRTADFLVVGGGIIGLDIARKLHAAFPGETVTLIEKEPDRGMYASVRNSGVLRARPTLSACVERGVSGIYVFAAIF